MDASSVLYSKKTKENNNKTLVIKKKDSLLVKKNECDAIHFEFGISKRAHTKHTHTYTKEGPRMAQFFLTI